MKKTLYLIMLLVLFCNPGLSAITDNANDLIVPLGESYTLFGAKTYINSVQITGTLYVKAYDGTTDSGKLELISTSVNVSGIINANGKGYPKNQGAGKGVIVGGYASGGGYGGNGGMSYGSIPGGSAYGSIKDPYDLGSGGGAFAAGGGSEAGSGGGAIKIRSTGIVRIDGIISSEGSMPGYGSTGGSGGSVYIIASQLEGSGAISASGSAATGQFGGGGGGRIAIYYIQNNFTGIIKAYGGLVGYGGTNYLGGAGTIFTKGSIQTNGDLKVDNNNNLGNLTPFVDGQYSFDNINVLNKGRLEISSGDTINAGNFNIQASGTGYSSGNVILTQEMKVDANGTMYQSGANINCNKLTIGNLGTYYLDSKLTLSEFKILSGGILTHSAGILGFDLTAGSITIDNGGSINAVGKGYPKNQGTGKGVVVGGYASGGGYGGNGGMSYGSISGGSVYGSIKEPYDFGSGGGAFAVGGGSEAGSGGGAIKIRSTGTVRIDGSIKSEGSLPGYGSTGGSGGSVYIIASQLEGSGAISASGSAATGQFGGGGGGRIAIYYIQNNFTGIIKAYGGLVGYGGTNYLGGAGTIFTKGSIQTNGDLKVDNNNNLGNLTPFVDGQYSFDNINVLNKAQLDIKTGNTLNVTQEFKVNANGIVNDHGGAFSASTLTIGNLGTFILDINMSVTDLKILSGGILTHSAGILGFDLTAENIFIEYGGSISATGKGFPVNQGPGIGGVYNGTSGGGAGYGGNGGALYTAVGGPAYGSAEQPISLGSGGTGSTGGAGGGAIKLNVNSVLHLEGNINVNGNNNSASGGSVYIITKNICGSGNISADGGSGYGGGGEAGSRYIITIGIIMEY